MTVLVGLMSGTSLDGTSAAVVRFRQTDEAVTPELLAFVSRAYSPAQRELLATALAGTTAQEYARLDFTLGEWFADAAVAAIAEAGVERAGVAAIASHGQTIWHDPPRATWQAGNAAVIAERTRIDVISDFRSRDVAAGGQGAPLVTIADAMLFSARDRWRAMLNIGGIANVQLVAPGGELASVRAFDTGPGVCVVDGVVRSLVRGRAWDEGGELARRGKAITEVVDELLLDPYFAAPPPKSTGRERFTRAYVAEFIERCRSVRRECTTEDVVATATLLTARSISLALMKFVPERVHEILISGGGANNPALVDAVRSAVNDAISDPPPIVPFASRFFDGDAKEAVAFAFLGWLHLQRRPGNVPNATGARGPRILGTFTPAG